jgi:hypothetical protein
MEVTRITPVINTSPRNYYEPFFIAGVGYNLEVKNLTILSPMVGYNILLRYSYLNAERIECDNQFSLGIKFSYKINL